MPMYNLTEYCDNYSKTKGSLWQYYTILNDGIIVGFIGNNTTDSFNFKEKITGQSGNNDPKDVEIMVPWKCH